MFIYTQVVATPTTETITGAVIYQRHKQAFAVFKYKNMFSSAKVANKLTASPPSVWQIGCETACNTHRI
jgi:hypothetical protein